MKKLLIGIVSLIAFLILTPSPVFAQATSPIFSTGGSGGVGHRFPHDIAFSSTPSLVGQDSARTVLTNWAGVPMQRMVCVESFNTANSIKTHLGCSLLNFGVGSNLEFNTPLSRLQSGTYRLVYTYQDSAGFWHQVTNISDKLVSTTVTVS